MTIEREVKEDAYVENETMQKLGLGVVFPIYILHTRGRAQGGKRPARDNGAHDILHIPSTTSLGLHDQQTSSCHETGVSSRGRVGRASPVQLSGTGKGMSYGPLRPFARS